MFSQSVRTLPGRYVISLLDQDTAPTDDWLCAVRAPEGLTVVRPARPGRTGADGETWAPLYSGGTAHGLDVPGMLAGLLAPLAAGGVPVFVASTHHADMVLVPENRLGLAVGLLRTAGHRVAETDERPPSPT
ncbi:ACT domain-containing protein [Streptomyces flavofungini]|uniref:ACT domain-containing protein n=1 Tax=Streptomyces flavofungini TaxID=68200 RepID=UPI0034DFB172